MVWSPHIFWGERITQLQLPTWMVFTFTSMTHVPKPCDFSNLVVRFLSSLPILNGQTTRSFFWRLTTDLNLTAHRSRVIGWTIQMGNPWVGPYSLSSCSLCSQVKRTRHLPKLHQKLETNQVVPLVSWVQQGPASVKELPLDAQVRGLSMVPENFYHDSLWMRKRTPGAWLILTV